MAKIRNTLASEPVVRSWPGWAYFERAKLCLEIAAIVTAGVWAYTRFVHDEAPSLELRADLGGKLGWEKVNKQNCQAEYEVQFQNIGKLPVTVATTQISVWYLSDPKATDKHPPVEYLDPIRMRQAPALYTSTNDRLVGRYGPGEKDTEGFSFVVQNLEGKRMLFEIEMWSEEDEKTKPRPKATWHDFRWDSLCGGQPERPKSPETKN